MNFCERGGGLEQSGFLLKKKRSVGKIIVRLATERGKLELSCDFCKWMSGQYWRKIRHFGSISRKTLFNSADVKPYSLR